MKKIVTKKTLVCGKCGTGEIVTTSKFDGEVNELNIKRCSNSKCKYQYHFKQLIDAKLESK